MIVALSIVVISILVGIYLAYRSGKLPPPSAAPAGSSTLLQKAEKVIEEVKDVVIGPSSPAPSPALPPQAGSSPSSNPTP